MRLTNQIRDNFIEAVMSDVPRIDYEAQAQELAKDYLDKQFALTFPGIDKNAVGEWLDRRSVYLPGVLPNVFTHAPDCNFLQRDKALWKQLTDLNEKHIEQRNKRVQLKEKLRSAANSATTRKALVELLPEFERYIPAEPTAAKMLPATVGIVDDFRAAGWPKNKKK